MADSQRKTANIYNKTNVITMSIGDRYGVYVPTGTYSIYNDTDNKVFWFAENGRSIFEACQPHSTSTVTLFGNTTGFYMPYNSASLGDITIVQGSTAPNHYIPYGWQHSLRKFTTATEAVENPLYSDGTAITAYTLKGNTVQNGTPTSTNPVEVNGVGERTENLFDGDVEQGTWNATITPIVKADSSVRCRVSNFIDVTENTQYTISLVNAISGLQIIVVYVDDNYSRLSETTWLSLPITFNTPTNCKYVEAIFRKSDNANIIPSECGNLMLNTGSTAKPYEPYGYKIPILNNAVTTNVYLGDVQTTRKIKKRVFRGVLNNDGWYYNSSVGEYDTYRTDVTSDKLFNVNMVLCTHFPNYGPGERIAAYEKALYIYVKRSEIGSLTELIQFLQQQNSNGTPVTVWYVRETPQAAAVNEPLMKIDTYADTLSNATAIPTIEGANSITIDTTVQPSEFTATWTGWHDASVKEKSANLFDSSKEFKNTYISIYNNTGTSAVTNTSDYIKINSSTLVLSGIRTTDLQNTSDRACCFYTANKILIDGVLNPADISTPCVIAVPQNTAYIRFAYDKSFEGAVMVNEGSTALPYEPYWK